MNDSFLPQDYTVPATPGDYTKLPIGTTKLRILSSPVMGYEDWAIGENGKNKPVRTKELQKPLNQVKDQQGKFVIPKHFWAMVVWNYDAQKIQIWQPTQKAILNDISMIVKDPDFADIYSYDIKVIKEGTGKDTKYKVMAGKETELTPNITQSYLDAMVDLDKLFD
jgi:hypothetical protein